MSDLLLNVKQISNYPTRQAADGSETLLVQVGGLGGPYQSIKAQVLASTALSSSSLGVGHAVPANAVGGQIFANELNLPRDGSVLWNAWADASWGLHYTLAGGAAQLGWDQAGGFYAQLAPAGQPNARVQGWSTVLNLSPAGLLSLPVGTVTVARDPSAPMEVTTRKWVNANTVASFNGRTGAVRLSGQDLHQALGLTADRIATERSVEAALTNLLVRHPFVWAFEGRTGNVWLELRDIHRIYFQTGARPLVPTPLPTAHDGEIVNAQWVNGLVWGKLWADLAGLYAPLNSPGFTGIPTAPAPPADSNDSTIPTTAWVMSHIVESTTGVVSFNGRTGLVTLTLADIEALFTATGATPHANTPLLSAINGELVTAQWVRDLLADSTQSGVNSFNTRFGDVTLTLADILGASGQQVTQFGTTAPVPANTGALWLSGVDKKLYAYDGTNWVIAGSAGFEMSDSTSPPASPTNGDAWWQTDTGEAFIWYVQSGPPPQGQWVALGGAAGPPGVMGPPGVPGPPGNPGPPGPGLRPMGNVPTFTALPTTGNTQGDMWLTTDTSHMYAWSDSISDWVDLGQIGAGMPDAPNDGQMYAREAPTPGGTVDWEIVKDDGEY